MAAETSSNPYDPPSLSSDRAPHTGLMLWGAVTVFGSMVVGALLGTAAGSLIGSIAPDYYRTVFGRADDPTFDAVQMGIGLGLTQGAFAGAVIGILCVGFFYWYRTRMVALSHRG